MICKAEWLKLLTVNAEVAKVMGLIQESAHNVESERQQMKQCLVNYFENLPLSLFYEYYVYNVQCTSL
jgi:hypothetical protein